MFLETSNLKKGQETMNIKELISARRGILIREVNKVGIYKDENGKFLILLKESERILILGRRDSDILESELMKKISDENLIDLISRLILRSFNTGEVH